jgi:transcriptional regulator with XRE-family HTH domain
MMTRLEQLRVDALLSREELAERTGVSVRTLRHLEANPPRRPRIQTIKPLALYFRVPASTLLSPVVPSLESDEPKAAA